MNFDLLQYVGNKIFKIGITKYGEYNSKGTQITEYKCYNLILYLN